MGRVVGIDLCGSDVQSCGGVCDKNTFLSYDGRQIWDRVGTDLGNWEAEKLGNRHDPCGMPSSL